jgi:hypothetical protein
VIYRSDDCPKNEPNLVTFVINCVVQDGTPLDLLIDLSTTGLCHLKMVFSITPNGQVCAGVMLSPIIPNFVQVGQMFLSFKLVDKI